MGTSTEEGKGAKTEKSPPPPTNMMNNCHAYPDWAAVQAFYGPRLAMPPYSNSPVASSPATPHYMWAASQSMIPHYGAPYFYAHYAHPGVPMVGTAPSSESPAKSAGNSDGAALKKHKEIDGLAISMGNGSVDNNDTATERRSSDSEATDDSSHGSSRALRGASKGHRKRSHQGSDKSLDAKAKKGLVFPDTGVCQASDKSAEAITPDALEKKTENVFTALDSKSVKSSPSDALQPVPSETWQQNERELKRERRKQSNRESARRSRLRKQAESEELASKVQALISDNMNLKSEMNILMERSTKLKLENGVLMGKLKDAQTEDDLRAKPAEPMIKKCLKPIPPLATVNLLARVNNSDGGGDQENDDGEVYEGRSSPVKLHQLLDAA